VSLVAVDPVTPSTLYVCSDKGILRSVDTGSSWTAINTGLGGESVMALAIDTLAPSTLYAIVGNTVYRSVDRGSSWKAMATGLPRRTDSRAVSYTLVVDPRMSSTLYIGYSSALDNTGCVLRSTDSGSSWTSASVGILGEDVLALAIDSQTPSTLYAGTMSHGVFRSTDSGGHWSRLNIGVTFEAAFALAIDPSTPSTLYAATSTLGVIRSIDSGDSWIGVNSGLPSRLITSIVADPLAPETLYAGTTEDGVYRSTDSGGWWTDISTGLASEFARGLCMSSVDPVALYACGEHSVFRYGVPVSCALTVSASPAAGGTIRRSPSAASYAVGAVVTLTASPAPGYVFTGWSGALTGTKNPATLKMNADKDVAASFAVKGKKVIQLKIGSSTMLVDGKSVALEAAPVILNSRTLLPIRAVVEAVGGTIAWEALTQKVTVVRKGRTVKLWIGRNVAELNGKSVRIDADAKVVPVIMSGRTLLPLRFVAEALELDVQWDSATKTVTIGYAPLP
jgi:uncharacterized repeat protein (TIGR02543 family)